MGQADFGTGKSLVVLAIVAGCFAILWPKIFYPMMQTAFTMTSPKTDGGSEPPFKDSDRPPHIHPGSINPRLRGAMPMSDSIQDKFNMREGRPFPHPTSRQPPKAQPKSGGAMSIMMPVYTVGIMVFFLYTVLKLVFKKPSENDKKPLIKDFHMDPEYRKFVCQQQSAKQNTTKVEKEEKGSVRRRKVESKPVVPEKPAPEFDEKDYEIYQLRKKLEETEQAMQRIMKHMGAMSQCLSEQRNQEKNASEKDCENDCDEETDSKSEEHCGSRKTSKKSKAQNGKKNGEYVNHESCKKLQEDLAKLISTSNLPKPFLEPDPVQPESFNDPTENNDENESEDENDKDTSQSERFVDKDKHVEFESCDETSCMNKDKQ